MIRAAKGKAEELKIPEDIAFVIASGNLKAFVRMDGALALPKCARSMKSGKFRVVHVEDLTELAYDGDDPRSASDLRNLIDSPS